MKKMRLPVQKRTFLLALGALLCTQCVSEQVEPKIDYDQVSSKLMAEVAPQLVGHWQLARVHVAFRRNDYYQAQASIKRDTVFQQLATLDIQRAAVSRHTPPDPRYPEFEGTIRYHGEAYPIYFSLRASPDRVVNNKGPQAIFSFEYNFPVGSHAIEPEETFLSNLGLMGDNYTLEILPDQPDSMRWHGLNRGVEKVELVRR